MAAVERKPTVRVRGEAVIRAEGVGAALGPPLRLAEPAGASVMIRAASRGGPEPLPVEPGEHEVMASIVVTFALECAGAS